jgi:Ni,Fe-hydrogenase III small subunit
MRLIRNALRPLSNPAPEPDPRDIDDLAARLDAVARARLGRALAIRHLGAGGCNGCELEVLATRNLVLALQRFGLDFVDNPRQADVLLVTGPLTRNMAEALARTRALLPEPGFVMAVGDCAVDGGVFKGSYAVEGGLPAPDLAVPGCPPSPTQILSGLLSLLAVQE